MRTPRPLARRRRGTVLPLLALTVTLLFAFVALAVDVGVLTIARTEAQNAVDASALAGARVLNNRPTATDNDKDDAITVARNTALTNINVFVQQNKKYTVAENMTFGSGQAVEVGQYNYDTGTQRFNVSFPANSGGTSWTAVKVRMKGDHLPFFAKVMGVNSMPWETYAVAVHRPRDIAIVLDFSASMQFGSQFNWENGFSGSGGQVYGMMSPDSIYPQFGHYARYTAYSNTLDPDVTNTTPTTPGDRINPFRTTRPHVMDGSGGSSEVAAPANYTVETPGGPPMILDFRFDPANVNNPATAVTTPNPSNYWNAFNRWMRTTPEVENVFLDAGFRPAVTSTTDRGSFTERTFNWAGYNAFDKTNQYGPTPAPDSYKDQSDADATYVGDRFARKGGRIITTTTAGDWNPTTATGAARDVRELLSAATAGNTTLIALGTRTTAPGTVPSGYTFPSPNGDGGAGWDTFRDDVWEKYGYDLDVAKYSGTAPAGTNRATAELRTANLFQGYSMGPGYYGKTFFMWPPDPRFDATADVTNPHATNLATDASGRDMHDWRRRFFYRGNFTEANATAATPTGRFDPQVDNDPTTGGVQSVNQCLLNNGAGQVLRDANNGGSARYRVNYRAVLAWLRSGPQTLPTNLRAGRIVYYTKIPTNVDDLTDPDKEFWRDYIDYVLGYTFNVGQYNPQNALAGNEPFGFPEGATPAVQATGPSGTNPRPYMNYTDNPSRPRLHFWFGPLTMLSFLNKRAAPSGRSYWLAGTVHEAQCWQLKSAMNSALDDIKNNHPNDFCSLVYFSNYNFQTPRVPMGQNWTNLKNSLFYPNSLIAGIAGGDTTSELRPYNSSMNNNLVGNIPNANGGTDPVSGMAMAFNTMANSAAYAARSPNGSVNGGTGRRGAAKICVFETDGVPNGRPQWAHQSAGFNSYYKEGVSSPGSSAADDAVQVVKKMCLAAGSGGFSLPSAPVRVYAIGFGDLFAVTPEITSATNAKNFLLNVQKEGGTSAATDTVFPASNIITGPYTTRITNMRNVLERIMQSGVQVTLVQ